jgi:hypothetical protein
MAHANARQWQRFSYHAEVQLGWSGAPPERRVQEAAVLDFSRGGMHVRTREAPDVGAVVSCKIAWSGRWFTLPGRVRWSRRELQPEDASEVGIEFGPLSPEENERVQQWVAGVECGEQRVQLRVGAHAMPLEAYALQTGLGVRLRVALPWLAVGSDLDFELAQPASKFTGRIVRSELRSAANAKQLELELRVEPREKKRARRYTMYEAPNVSPGAWAALHAGGEREPDFVVPKAWVARALLPALCAVIVVSGAVLLLPQTWRAGARVPTVRPAMHADAHAQVEDAARREREREQIGRPAPAVTPERAATSMPAATPEPTTTTTTTTTTPLASPQLATIAVADKLQPMAADGHDVPAAISGMPTATGAPALLGEPRLTVSGDTSEIFVPVEGSTNGLRTAMWVEPLALVVDLPAGRVKLTHTRYAFRAGGVAALGVGNNRGVTQVRVFLDALLARYSVQELPGGMSIRLRRDLQPMP